MSNATKNSVLGSISVYYFLRARTVFVKKCNQFRCTGLLRSSKQVHLDDKNLTCITINLVQNFMSLVSISKKTGSVQKMVKTKATWKKRI